MLGWIGVIAGVALLIVLALRGTNMIFASLLGASLVAICNGISPLDALTGNYVTEMAKFTGPFFLLFVAGAVFGRVMGDSHAATSIALAMTRALGAERTLYIAATVCALLTYGGVNVFVVVFTMYPIGLGLMRESGIPKRLFNAACGLGAGTFTMTCLPGSPSLQNNVAARAMGTTLTAAPGIGLFAAALMIVMAMFYLERERKRARLAGDVFRPGPADVPPPLPEHGRLPAWGLAMLPLAVVLSFILLPTILQRFVPPAADAASLYSGTLKLAGASPLNWTIVALAAGTLAGVILFRPWLSQPLMSMGRGAESSIIPMFNTAVIIGFGGVVKATPAFGAFAAFMLHSGLPPLWSAAISINVLAGIMGSSTGALQIFATSLAPQYLATGVNHETLHRIVAIGSGGLAALPHCGAIVTTFVIMGVTHREAYKDIGIVCVVVPLITLVAVLILCSVI